MKKLFVLILALILVSTSTLFVSALDTTPNIQPAEQVTAQLVDDSGNMIPITGHLITASTARTFSSDAAVTYRFLIYEHELTKSGPDSTLSSTVTLTIYYNTYTHSSGLDVYLLTRVEAAWAISDAFVSVTAATLNYGCSGYLPEGGYANQADSVNPPAYFGGYNVSTGFDEYVLSESVAVMGASLILNYARGSRTWTFTMQNNLFNT